MVCPSNWYMHKSSNPYRYLHSQVRRQSQSMELSRSSRSQMLPCRIQSRRRISTRVALALLRTSWMLRSRYSRLRMWAYRVRIRWPCKAKVTPECLSVTFILSRTSCFSRTSAWKSPSQAIMVLRSFGHEAAGYECYKVIRNTRWQRAVTVERRSVFQSTKLPQISTMSRKVFVNTECLPISTPYDRLRTKLLCPFTCKL